MSEPDRALAPLDEARAAISRLDTYTTPQELAGALDAIGQAVERSLRQLLRLDPSLPDDVRLHALDAAALPYERVIASLRQQNRISLELANQLSEVRRATERAGAGDVRAADADRTLALVQQLRTEVREGPPPPSVAAADVRAVTHAAVERGEFDEAAHEVSSDARRAPLRLLLLAGAVLLALAGWFIGRRLFGPSELDQGVTAFQQGRMGVAEQHFRASLKQKENPTAELYLGRILRRQGRFDEAAAVLNAARKRYPRDADIVRELGHLLGLDLRRPQAAVELYRRAVQLSPEEPANWVALVRALRALHDPAADEVLSRAPAEAQTILRKDVP